MECEACIMISCLNNLTLWNKFLRFGLVYENNDNHMTFVGNIVYLCPSYVVSFAPQRARNKLFALQKSCDCPIIITLIPIAGKWQTGLFKALLFAGQTATGVRAVNGIWKFFSQLPVNSRITLWHSGQGRLFSYSQASCLFKIDTAS